jgi:hypothetical protein
VALLSLMSVLGYVPVELLRRHPPEEGSLLLDRHYQLSDRVTNALSFSALPEANRTPFMRAAIQDAMGRAEGVRARPAVPLQMPGELWVSVLLIAGLVVLSRFEVRRFVEVPIEVSNFTPLALAADDIGLLREMADELEKESQDPDAKAAAQALNRLIEDLAEKRLDRHQVFSELEKLERELSDSSAAELAELEEALDGVAGELKKSRLSKPVAEALEAKSLPDAEKAMRELAEKLKEKRRDVTKAELDKLRDALKSASESTSQRLERLEATRKHLEEQQKRLLKKKQEGKPLTAAEREQLADQKRRLERLDRKKRAAEQAGKEMDELDRQIAEAARKLAEEMGAEQGAENLERAAEDLNRMAQKQMSREEKEALKKRIEELRELLRQQGKASKEQIERMKQFARRARGGQPGGAGKPGQGQGGSRPGMGQVPIPVPGAGQGQSAGSEQPGSSASPGTSDKWGTGTDPNLQGEATKLDGKVQDVSAAGIDSGEGPSNTSVVYGAAERGFSGGAYEKVYTDYKTVAEEVIERDDIPPGYKFYVRRYFQLIRPRN